MRVRLIPVLMFALAATLSIRMGSVWTDLDIGIGATSSAQNATQNAAQNAAHPGDAVLAPSPDVAVAAPEPSVPGDSIDPATEQQATAGNVPDDPFEYSDEEIEVLQQLAKRREELELHARQIEEREALVAAAEMRMEQKMGELKALQSMVEDLLAARSEAEEAELKSLVKIYENMKPKDAAQVFEELDMDILLEVVDRMSERKAAPVLALINPTRTKELTLELAERRRMPLPE